jgi:periplasmic protein TonB
VMLAPAPPPQTSLTTRGEGGAVAAEAAPPKPQALPSPDYLKRLMAHLNAYKHYPYEASRRRETGTVDLHFIMDRSGRVLSYEVVKSSGSSALDNEAKAMIVRAQPLPPVPPAYPGERLDLVVPLIFSLR